MFNKIKSNDYINLVDGLTFDILLRKFTFNNILIELKYIKDNNKLNKFLIKYINLKVDFHFNIIYLIIYCSSIMDKDIISILNISYIEHNYNALIQLVIKCQRFSIINELLFNNKLQKKLNLEVSDILFSLILVYDDYLTNEIIINKIHNFIYDILKNMNFDINEEEKKWNLFTLSCYRQLEFIIQMFLNPNINKNYSKLNVNCMDVYGKRPIDNIKCEFLKKEIKLHPNYEKILE